MLYIFPYSGHLFSYTPLWYIFNIPFTYFEKQFFLKTQIRFNINWNVQRKIQIPSKKKIFYGDPANLILECKYSGSIQEQDSEAAPSEEVRIRLTITITDISVQFRIGFEDNFARRKYIHNCCPIYLHWIRHKLRIRHLYWWRTNGYNALFTNQVYSPQPFFSLEIRPYKII